VRRPVILVIHGPNLNLLGTREPHIYGHVSLAEIDSGLRERGGQLGISVETFQSNHEGALIDRVQRARGEAAGLIVNAGGLTHTSVALRDAVTAAALPTVEVHLSNLHAREEFRHRSLLAPVCLGQIAGLGPIGYRLALEGLVDRISRDGPSPSRRRVSPVVPRPRSAAPSAKKGVPTR
jgi:3-dehydroquinate dehydratase-2